MELRILKFGATWCQPCKVLDPILEQVKTDRPDLKFESYDSELDVALFSEYRISSVPTVIILKDDVECERFVGVLPKPKIISIIDKCLQNG